MGGSTFVFIESKTFEFVVEEGELSTCYVFMREAEIPYALFVWGRRVL